MQAIADDTAATKLTGRDPVRAGELTHEEIEKGQKDSSYALQMHKAPDPVRRTKGPRGYIEAVLESKDPPKFIILLEDTAALIGLLIALSGTLAAAYFDNPLFDGVASVAIGALLGATATLLARESKHLLIGEGAHPALTQSILRIAQEEPGVAHAHGALTVHLAPRQIVAALSIEFTDQMTAPQIEKAVESIEARIHSAHPEVVMLFVKPQTGHTFSAAREWRLGARAHG